MPGAKFTNTDEYFASLDTTKATTLRSVLDAVLAVSPDLHAVIAWNVPQIKHANGKYVFGMSAAKNHLSLAPWSKDAMAQFASEIAAYDPTDAMFRVPVDWTVDTALIHGLVTVRLAEIGVS